MALATNCNTMIDDNNKLFLCVRVHVMRMKAETEPSAGLDYP